MDSFYNTVIIAALVLLILVLTYAGYILHYYQYGKETWPKNKSPCPDSWEYISTDSTGNHICFPNNEYNKGKNDFSITNPDGSDDNSKAYNKLENTVTIYTYDKDNRQFKFDKDVSKCDIKSWADYNKIKWDGVTNYNDC